MPKKTSKRKSDSTLSEESVSKVTKLSSDISEDTKSEMLDKNLLKIISFNVAGIRAWAKKEGFKYLREENADIVCLQETKCSKQKLPLEANVPGYYAYWLSSKKEGYCGIGLYSKVKPLQVNYGIGDETQDAEARIITAEYEHFFLVNVYVPNAGRGLVTLPKRMAWDKLLRAHLTQLDVKKPVVLCGDMNVAHQEIDLKNPKSNTKNAGFTKEERDGFTELLDSGDGYIDTFRHFYPHKTDAFTFWTFMGNARARNVGWRLDYFVVSKRFLSSVKDSVIKSHVMGSDHCPVVLYIQQDHE